MSSIEALIENVEVSFVINDAIVEQYPYRTMLLGPGTFLEMKRIELNEFEQQLSVASGKPADNHVVYGITQKNGSTLYVWFHDLEVTFGLTIR